MNRAVSETSYLVQALLYLPYFWFVEGVRYFTRTVWRVIVYLDQITATTLMARLLFIPLFGDFTFFVRILGFPFRLVRLLIGAIAVVLGAVCILGFFLLGVLLPFWLFFNFPSIALMVFAVAGFLAFYKRMGRSHLEITGPWEDKFYFLDFVHKSAPRAF